MEAEKYSVKTIIYCKIWCIKYGAAYTQCNNFVVQAYKMRYVLMEKKDLNKTSSHVSAFRESILRQCRRDMIILNGSKNR